MKPRILAASIALLLTPAAFAITDTWDGGGADNNFLNGNNWLDNTAPLSDPANTDLIFAGSLRTSPVFSGAFSAKSLTFNNTAGDFVLSGGGFTLTVGAGGITNVDLSSQSFGPVAAAASQTISSGNGSLNFNGGLSIASIANVTLAGGGPITIANFQSGTGTLTKGNAGNLLVKTSATPILADLNLTAGNTLLTPAGGTQTVGSTGSIAVSATATFTINENLTLTAGAQLTRSSSGAANIASGKTLRIEGGSDFVNAADYTLATGNLTVSGVGSTLQSSATTVTGDATLTVQNGGSVQGGTYVDVGISSSGTLLVDGAGSSVSGNGSSSFWGAGTGANATVNFSNNASGTFSDLHIGRTGGSATAQILSGADIINPGGLAIATAGVNPASGALLLSGAGTTWLSSGGVNVGATALGVGVGSLTVGAGAVFTANSTFSINLTGTVNLVGGTLAVSGGLTKSGEFNFTSGALSIADNWIVGAAGILGGDVTLDAARRFTTTGTTTVDALNTLTLNGGSLTTAAVVNNGAVAFGSGTLAITGAGGLSTSALGANVTLGTGANLQVTNTAAVANGASLIVDGGSVTAGALTNGGLVEHDRGTLTIAGALTNQTGADFFAAKPLTVGGVFTNQTGARLTLQNGTGRVNGAGSISNAGLITGDGTIAVTLNNFAGGEVRGESGKTLAFTGTTGANAGRVNLLGGTVSFAQQFTNAATGQINGQGALYFPTTPVPSSGSPTAGLMNSGNLNLSGGDSQIFGTVQMLAGSRLTVSGGATASFFDVFRHSGLDVKASAGSAIVFFGEVRGAGSFSGTGTIYFEGGYSPGNSPAAVTLGSDIVFGSANTLTLELGGLTAGAQYDQLILGASGSLALDGALVLDLIDGFLPHFGDTFQLLDFDPGQVTGAFDEITIADALPGNLSFDTSALSTTGKITVVPEPGVACLLLLGTALFGLHRRRCIH